MELDDLKQAWQQQTPESIDVRNDKNIIDMIQNKSYGPLASLKSRYERNFYIMAIACAYLIFHFSIHPYKWQRWLHGGSWNIPPIVGWFLLVVAVVAFISQAWSYALVRKMQHIRKPIKSDIESKLSFIDKSLKIQRLAGIFLLVGICIAVEFVTYRQRNGGMKSWYDVPVYLRYLAYMAYLAFIYFLNKRTCRRNFGKHIDCMKDLLGKIA